MVLIGLLKNMAANSCPELKLCPEISAEITVLEKDWERFIL